ncbi:MAG: hypothetical protein MI725_12615, partial [Pirellulales bacterium]|nr:hypothetical protein [Pirellulales bacterium]
AENNWAFDSGKEADWNIPGISTGPAELVALTARENDDEGFTNKHIEIIAEFHYELTKTNLQYRIWAYPEAPGLRVQVWLKAGHGFQSPKNMPEATLLALSTDTSLLKRCVATYSKFNSSRSGRYEKFPMMKEETSSGPVVATERFAKAALVQLVAKHGAVALVKEAPAVDSPVRVDKKTRKQREKIGWSPYRIGGFEVSANQVAVTGAGIAASDIAKNQWRQAYATWIILAKSDNAHIQQAIKRFDRFRFPFDWKKDWYIGANNWGSAENAKLGQISSQEPSILQEIEAAAEIGIELVQIDDGWQQGRTSKLDPESYPQGWSNVLSLAKANNIRLGLWQGWVQNVSISGLIHELNAGEFHAVKLDFYNTSTFNNLQKLRDIARQIHCKVEHPITINWDTTGTQSKDQGFFYGREYGNLWPENQKQHQPDHTLYRPWRVLRDAWEISHYVNLDQVQLPIQNPGRNFEEPSDASLHSHSYCTAIALMGSPNFFQELKYQTPEAKQEIREILDSYKKVRPQMAQGIVYPIGSRPDNSSWTGFQNYDEDTGRSYLLVFRERLNQEDHARIKLKVYPARVPLRVTDLLSGQTYLAPIDEEQRIKLCIPQSADFRFLECEME